MPENDHVDLVIRRIAQWVRGDRHLPTVVTEHVDSLGWLASPATGLVGPDTVVLCAVNRRSSPTLPHGPGMWQRGTGGLGQPGDDVGIGDDFYLETVDYAAVPHLGIVGPTAVRVTSAADADALVADAGRALETGHIPPALLHRSVELGDRCALIRSADCAGRALERVHIDAAGVVRTSPVGRVLGRAAGDVPTLQAEAECGADPCLDHAATAVLATVPDERVAAFVAGLGAVRTLSRRLPGRWSVVGGPTALLGSRPSTPPRADRVLLTDGTTFVLSDAECVRTFRVGRAVAEVVEAILTSESADEAALRLRTHGTAARTVEEIEDFRTSCAERGLELAHAGV